jgi:hypothetical protein
MLVDGPLYQLELVQRPVNQVTERIGNRKAANSINRPAAGWPVDL